MTTRFASILRCLACASLCLFLAACSTLDRGAAPELEKKADWTILPFANHTETPMAGMRAEAISEALPDVKVYIDTSGENGVQKVLPLESFTQGDVTTTAPEKGEE